MVELLTKDTFIERIFDFKKETDWKFKGKKPVIIDFYVEWCSPCKMISHVIDEISNEYRDVIDIYKVNTESQRELSAMFDVRNIPTILFIPLEGHPRVAKGVIPKEGFEQVISDIFDIKR